MPVGKAIPASLGNIITVAKSRGDYASIQAAIDAAVAGDTVLIYPGIYGEAVITLKDGVVVRGIDRSSVTLNGRFIFGGGIFVVSDITINPAIQSNAFGYIDNSQADRRLRLERITTTYNAQYVIWDSGIQADMPYKGYHYINDCELKNGMGGFATAGGGGTIDCYNTDWLTEDINAQSYTQSAFVVIGSGSLESKFVDCRLSVKRKNVGSSADSSFCIRTAAGSDNANCVFIDCDLYHERTMDAVGVTTVNSYAGANNVVTLIEGRSRSVANGWAGQLSHSIGTINVFNHDYTVSGGTITQLGAYPAGKLLEGITAKTTPVDADMVGLMDSAASNILKKLSWANIKATLVTYFNGLYLGISAKAADSELLDGQDSTAFETPAGAQTKVNTHEADTTSIHGITNTSDLGLKSGDLSQFASGLAVAATFAGADTTKFLFHTGLGALFYYARGLWQPLSDTPKIIRFCQVVSSQENVGSSNYWISAHSAGEEIRFEFNTGATNGSRQTRQMGGRTIGNNQPVWEFPVVLGSLTNIRGVLGLSSAGTAITTPTSPPNGIWFYWNSAVNGNWWARCALAGAGTEVDTGVATSIAAIQYLGFRHTGSAVEFYINGNLVATISTNLPTTAILSAYFYIENLEAANKALYVGRGYFYDQA